MAFTASDLDAVFSDRTRVVLLNTPLNPTGTVFPKSLLELLASYCVRHDTICISDEVWEHVLLEGNEHVPMMTIAGMRDRTVKVGSAGKIFSLTGWKVGLVVGGAGLLRVVSKAHQFLTLTTPPNLQAAVAYGLMKPDSYFSDMRAGFQRSRDRLTRGLQALGFDVIPSQGTYFLNIDIAPLGEADDFDLCKRLVVEHGVAAIPVSAFYAENPVRNVVRLCFSKNDQTLDAGLDRLARAIRKYWKAPMKSELRALLLVALTGLGLLSQEVLAGDRVVHVDNWSDYIDARSLDEFTRETGIKVVYDTYDSTRSSRRSCWPDDRLHVVTPSATFLQRQI